MKKKGNTTSNENNDGEIRLEISYNGGNENDNGKDNG